MRCRGAHHRPAHLDYFACRSDRGAQRRRDRGPRHARRAHGNLRGVPRNRGIADEGR